MISYRSRWLKYVELWFDESCQLDDFDVVFRYRSCAPVQGATNEEFYTLVVDLTKSEHELLSDFRGTTRSAIKEAEAHDNLSHRIDVCSKRRRRSAISSTFYDEFARGKGIAIAGTRPHRQPACVGHIGIEPDWQRRRAPWYGMPI